jgi:hypothetical protein
MHYINLHHPARNAPQWCASWRMVFSLDKRILQATAMPRNPSHLPYKEEVAGSNPASPTWKKRHLQVKRCTREGWDMLRDPFTAAVLQPSSLGRL